MKKEKKGKKKEKKLTLAGIEPQSSDYESRAKPTELLRQACEIGKNDPTTIYTESEKRPKLAPPRVSAKVFT